MKKEKQKIAEHLHKSACGYGLKLPEITTCIESIPDKLLQDFIYTLSRIAEKSGHEGFTYGS